MKGSFSFQKKKKKKSQEMSLQITSMADIFVIILVFLLKSFSTGTTGITPGQGVGLPEARAGKSPGDSAKIEIAANLIMLDDVRIADLKNFALDATDLRPGGHSESLVKAMKTDADKRRKPASAAPAAGEAQPAMPLLILADRKTPWQTLRIVIASAAQAGFTGLKLVVAEPQ